MHACTSVTLKVKRLALLYLPVYSFLNLCLQGPELGIVGVTASLFSIIIPLCCSCCHFWRDSKRKAKTISNQTGDINIVAHTVICITLHTEHVVWNSKSMTDQWLKPVGGGACL